jgi:hypothetical protein
MDSSEGPLVGKEVMKVLPCSILAARRDFMTSRICFCNLFFLVGLGIGRWEEGMDKISVGGIIFDVSIFLG